MGFVASAVKGSAKGFGVGLYKGVRVVVPWCMVLLPVVFLFTSALNTLELSGTPLSFELTFAGGFIFVLGFVYMAWKHEKAIRDE